MQRHQLEHALRAAREITKETEFVVLGSSALLGQVLQPPPELAESLEVDMYPRYKPRAAQLLNAIGELSLFHQTHGFWVDPVGPETSTLPTGWEQRLVKVCNPNTGGATGWCLEVHDLAASKLVAGRDKDLEFVAVLLRERMADPDTLAQRVAALPLAGEQLTSVQQRLAHVCRCCAS
jgi:hypothetical protein